MDLSPSAHTDTFARDHLPPPHQLPRPGPGLPGPGYPERLNCAAELLDGTVTRHGPDRPAFRHSADPAVQPERVQVWSYGELLARTDQIAHQLTGRLGVQPGNRVLLRGPNSPQLAACWLAILKAGGIAVTVLAGQRPQELRTICEIARVQHALCDEQALEGLSEAGVPDLRVTAFTADDLPPERAVAVPGGHSADPVWLAPYEAGVQRPFEAVPTAADDVALIAFTSGTTGRPKGCVHFHRDVLAIADTFSDRVLQPRPDDVFGGSPPLGFTFGLGGLVIFPLRAGACSVLEQWNGTRQMLEAVQHHRISVLFTAPTAYRGMLAELHDADGTPASGTPYDLSSLRRCVAAGENLPAATWHSWYERTGLRLINGIGATELLHIFVAGADDTIRPGTTGVPVPGWSAQVMRPADDGTLTPVPDGEPGLLAVRGPVGCRYLNDARQQEYVRDGWNVTGDTYVREPDGYFRYVARSDDMIISAGYNIPGPEVEEALLRHPDVQEAAVVGRADTRRGQIAVAHVVLREGTPRDAETADALRKFVATELVPYKRPREVVFADALPRTATGKLQRFRLREDGPAG